MDGFYHVTWMIDEKKEHGIQLMYGIETSFYIYCSVEHRLFMGEHLPSQDNYGLFDYVEYKSHEW